jgi:hypothetical protein
MTHMKKTLELAVVALAAITLTTIVSVAAPMGHGNDAMDYLLKAPNLSRVGAGVYFSQAQHDIHLLGSAYTAEMTTDRLTAYVGVDLFKWMNVYAVGGTTSAKLNDSDEGDGGLTFGAGVSLNLLNHFIREPVPLEDAFRINLGAQVLANEADLGSQTVRWLETTAALTFALVNHIDGNKEFSPESIALYAGPALFLLENDDFVAETEGGAIGGIMIFFTDSCALDLRVEYFDHANISAGINLRF